MSVSRRIFRIVRYHVRDVAEQLAPTLGRLGERVAGTWRETRRGYQQGRSAGDAAWEDGAAGGATGSRSAGDSGGRRNHGSRATSRDPRLAGWYANLEVPYDSDLDTVTRAWKRLVRLYHPDRHDADPQRREHATELVKGINNAYEQLRRHLDPTRSRR